MVGMIEHKGTFYAGVFIFLIPFLGFPTMWKMVLVAIAGFLLVVVSLKVPLPRSVLKNKLKKEILISSNSISNIKHDVKIDNVVNDIKVDPVVITHTPKIDIIVPKKRKTSSKTVLARKLNIQE